MLGPLVVLAVGAIGAGWALNEWFIGADFQHFWNGSIYNGQGNDIIQAIDKVPDWVETAPLVLGIAGILIAFVMYIVNPLLPVRMAQVFGPIYRLFLNKWYVDELYDRIFVQPAIRLAGVFWQVGDATLIDGVPNGLAELTAEGSKQIVKIQTGSLAVYAFAMLIGVVVLVAILMLSR